MKYLCRVKSAFRGFNKGEEVILPKSFVEMYKKHLEIIKEYPDKIDVVTK